MRNVNHNKSRDITDFIKNCFHKIMFLKINSKLYHFSIDTKFLQKTWHSFFFYLRATEFNVFDNTLFQNTSNITRNASKGQTRPNFLHINIIFLFISLYWFFCLAFYACSNLKLISLLTLSLYHHHHPPSKEKKLSGINSSNIPREIFSTLIHIERKMYIIWSWLSSLWTMWW